MSVETKSSLAFFFPSREVRDICSHLTPDEQIRLTPVMKVYGSLDSGVFMAFLWGLGDLAEGQMSGVSLMAIVAIFLMAKMIALPGIRVTLKALREKLCDTEFARAAGYKPEALRLYSFSSVFRQLRQAQ